MTEPTVVEEPLELQALIDAVSHDAAGAVATFLGVVRDHNDGQPVTVLEYHAYRSMAETEVAAIVREVEAEVTGARVAVKHRVGRLKVGEPAVICAASAPHRDEAFRACRLLIDRIKARVPIWKKEHGPTGPHWVGWADARQ